jgi:DNA-binding winged helix-turn-helix (wHTH) protein/Tol biopolymer transport system component
MMAGKSFVFRFADVEVREREFALVKSGETLAVEPKAFRVLLILLRNPGKLIPKQELLDAVWGDAAVTENSLARAVALLRKLLGDEAHSPRFIETVATVGYRWLGRVDAVEDPSGLPAPFDQDPLSANYDSPAPGTKATARWSSMPTVAGAAALVAVALAAWYLVRPLPLPRVTTYTQITRDGNIRHIAGTDGSRIYFNSSQGVAQVGVEGGEIVPVPIESIRAGAVALSGDGVTLLIRSANPNRLFTVGTLGGSPRLVADWTGHCGVAWSPDSKYLAYTDCHGDLLVTRIDGTEIRKLATVKSEIVELRWSPDGSRIRFTMDDMLWEVSASGTGLHKVLPGWKGPAGHCCGRWTANGDFYFFLAGGSVSNAGRDGGFEQIWVLDERHRILPGSSPPPLQLTSGPIHWGWPFPSRDGEKIFSIGTIPRGELVAFDTRGKALQPFLGGISAEFLAYSSDGTQMSYVTYPEGILWRAKADGSERVQLTNPPLRPFVCNWSPDGTKILFFASRGASGNGLYTVSTQGGSPQLLLSPDDPVQSDGGWSPDGHQIVYQTGEQPSLRILNTDSSKANKIPGSEGLYSPRWSPDGRYIAALALSNAVIRIFDLQTRHWSTLAEHNGTWGFPTWSHDGKFLYALNGPIPWSVYRIPVSGGNPQRIVEPSTEPLAGAYSGWFGLDPNDTPLLLRNHGTSDIYALTLER